MKEVRAKLEEAPARICGAVLFAVLAVLNRDSVFHMLLCAGGSLVWLLSFFYSYLRYKRWKIEITEKDVIYTNTFGKKHIFRKCDVRWKIVTTFYYRQVHILLYNYTEKKQIVSIPCDWYNVRVLLLELHHFGRITKEEQYMSRSLRAGGQGD